MMVAANAHKSAADDHTHRSAREYFDPAEYDRMQRDDSTAFSIVAAELLAIVVLGFALVAGTVTLIVLRS